MRKIIIVLIASVLFASPAFAWWDTIVKKWTFPPLVESYPGEEMAKGVAAGDPLAQGGKAALVSKGTPALSFTRALTPSVYGLWICGRSPREGDIGEPGGMPALLLDVTVALPDGTTESYRVRGAYQYVYPLAYGPEDFARCFFRVKAAGEVSVKVAVADASQAGPILIDRIELRDVLGNCAKKRGKTARTMISDAELANLRGGNPKPATEAPREKVLALCEAYWTSFPPANAPRNGGASPTHYTEKDRVPVDGKYLSTWQMNPLDRPWQITQKDTDAVYSLADYQARKPLPGPLPDAGWGVTVEGLRYTWGKPPTHPINGTFAVIAPLFRKRVIDLSDAMINAALRYETTGDMAQGLKAAALLVAFAYNYPVLDMRSQGSWVGLYGRYYFTNHVGGGIVQTGLLEGHRVRDYVRTYDRVYDVLAANPAFAEFLGTKLPDVKTTDDLIRFLDTNLLQRTADVIMRADVAGDPLKMSRALTMAAICQGVNDISRPWVDTLFTDIPMGMIEPGGLEDMAVGNLGRGGLVSKGSGGYSKGSIMSFLEVATSLKAYGDMGGRILADLTNLKKYPWFGQALYGPINLRTAGGWVPLIGDYGDPLRTREVFFDRGPTGGNSVKGYYLEAWRLTGDPAFAFLTARYKKRTVESPEEWAKINAEAAKVRDPLNARPPRVLDDFGLAVLETGQQFDDFTKKRSVTLRYGHGHTHGHNDGLSMSVFGKGMRAISDLAARAGSPNPRRQKMHSTVEVDRKGMNNGDALAAGYGWINAFAPMGDVQYVDASQRAISHPQLQVYRRGVALINVGDEESYVFNCFRVKGGKVHTWAAHANQNDRFEVNAPLKEAATPAVKEYLAGYKPNTDFSEPHLVKDLLPKPVEGVAPDALTATWRLHERAEQAFLKTREALPEDRKIYARWRLFGHRGDTLMAADGTSKRYRYDMSFLYVQDADAGEAGNVYPSLAEVYQGAPVVQSARALKVENAGEGAAATVAVEVKLPGGVTDICLSGPGDGTVRTVEGGIQFDGLFGFVRRDAKGVVRADLVGGTRLSGQGFEVTTPAREISGAIAEVRPEESFVEVQGYLSETDLTGHVVLTEAPDGRRTAWTVDAIQKQRPAERMSIRFEERMKVFQSAITHVDPAAHTISVVAEPYNLKADQHAYDYTLAANESLTKRWPAKVVTDTRWIIVKTPVADADIPDADGDGRRTLKLIGNENEGEKAGKPVLEMEVTRIDPDARTIYFKTPAPPYDIGGWNYVARDMVGESGKTWRGTYPGIEYKVVVEGDVARADFDDANRDGRTLLSLYRLGPNHKFIVPTRASVIRTAGGYTFDSVGTPVKATAE